MIFYIYLGYPAFVFIMAAIKNRKVKKGPFVPYATFLISVYNEDEYIDATIKNKLALNYPKEKLEIIVISDGSTDRTDEIVKQYEDQGVKLLRQEPRAGKTSALNMAAPKAKGDVLIFSDANSLYEENALINLMKNFKDSDVGYVTGKMIYTNPDGSPIGEGCTAYMKYENQLRSWETNLGSIVGVDGGIDASRKELYQPMNADQLPDFVLPLKVIEQGYRVVFEPGAILKEPSLTAGKDEYKMRVRVTLRALWGMWDMRNLLTFSPSALFSWQLWSHKVLRYLCFFFLLLAYLSNLALWPESAFYKFLFILQNIAYLGAVLSPVLEKKDIRSRALYLLHYFTLLNLASAHAFIKFLLGQKTVMWTPRKG